MKLVKENGKCAFSVTVGEKGQIVIPKQARDLFGIKPGDALLILADEERGIVIPPKETMLELANRIFGEEVKK